jgi:hypothetical protein
MPLILIEPIRHRMRTYVSDLLAEADRFEAAAKSLVTDPSKPDNWVDLWAHWLEQAQDKRQHAEATAVRSGIDFCTVVQNYQTERRAGHAKQRSA